MALKKNYVIDARFKSKEEFLELYKHPFLVQFEEKSSDSGQRQVAFATVTAHSMEELIKFHNKISNQKIIKNVYPVTKTERNPFASKIIVGRTSAQDISIQDLSISKFHAYFETKDEKDFTIIDRGSTNGTFLNGSKLPPNESFSIKNGDNISFSKLKFTFYTPENAFIVFKDAIESEKEN